MTIVTRRSLLGGMAALSATAAVATPGRGRALPWPPGVQLWSVDAELGQDFAGTLRRLAGIGYRRVEAAGWHGRAPDAFRRAVEGVGMRCDSAHISMPDLVADMRAGIGRARDAGCDYLICSAPLTPTPIRPGRPWLVALREAMTPDAWKRNAMLLNQAGTLAAAAGLGFGYHNHTAEFARYDGVRGVRGVRGYDVLLAGTDPNLVRLELDVAWTAAAGQDVAALIRANRGRIARLHLKDLRATPARGQMAADPITVPVGQGVLDWRAILREAVAAGVTGAYVELEPPHRRSPFDELAEARDFLTQL